LRFETLDFTGADDFKVESDDGELYDEEADQEADTESVSSSNKEDEEEEAEGDEDDKDPDGVDADDEEPVQRRRQNPVLVKSSVRASAQDEDPEDLLALSPVVWHAANPKPQRELKSRTTQEQTYLTFPLPTDQLQDDNA
ncbi:hypothetical protein KCU95_g10756, partial [Aureobasidium melanogenum]